MSGRFLRTVGWGFLRLPGETKEMEEADRLILEAGRETPPTPPEDAPAPASPPASSERGSAGGEPPRMLGPQELSDSPLGLYRSGPGRWRSAAFDPPGVSALLRAGHPAPYPFQIVDPQVDIFDLISGRVSSFDSSFDYGVGPHREDQIFVVHGLTDNVAAGKASMVRRASEAERDFLQETIDVLQTRLDQMSDDAESNSDSK